MSKDDVTQAIAAADKIVHMRDGQRIREADIPKLRVLTAEEFIATDIPPRELLLSPWLPAQGLALLFAIRGVGKTHVSLGIAFAVVRRTRFPWTQNWLNRSVQGGPEHDRQF